MKKLLLMIVAVMQLVFLFGQLPAYYNGISTTDSNEVLKIQLANLIISTHTTQLSYTPGIWNLLEKADRDLEDTTKVLLLYGFNDTDGITSNDRTRLISLRQTGSSVVGFWNREHSFPKSLGTPDLGTSGAGADGHHLRAADGQMNSTRNNRLYAYGDGNATTIGSNQFYPGDEWKGDVARMTMYMYLRYPTQCVATQVGGPVVTASTFDQMPDIFLIWHEEDPVSDFERQRNEKIYQAQGNRNPFIDEPAYAKRIWGNVPTESGLNINEMKGFDFQVYPNPTSGKLTIVSNMNDEINYTITNTLGQEMIQETGNVIDLSTFETGVYILEITSQNQVYSTRVVKN